MATLTRSSVQRSTNKATRITRDMVDELRVIIGNRGMQEIRPLVAEFVGRHRLTHHDVDRLLVSLAQNDVRDVSAIFTVPPTAHADYSADEPSEATLVPVEVAGASDVPYGSADAAETDATTGLAWMFDVEPELPAPRASGDIVGQAFDDLFGDWSRTGGQLTRAEVAVLATRRKLSPGQHGELLDLLEEAGVDLPAPTDLRPRQAAPKGYELREDGIGQYLRAVGRYPLINAYREVELWSLIGQGVAAREELDAAGKDELAPALRHSLENQAAAGRRAHGELVCANLRLVVSIAKARHYESSGVEFADRIQDGNLGLMRAADKFDGSKGFKFSTYASWWIKQAIERGIGDRGRTIRIPFHLHEKVQKVRRALSKLTARLEREPTLAEVSDATGIEPGKVQAALDLMRPLRSLDELLGDEGDLHLSDVLVSEDDRDGRTDPAAIVIHAMFREDVAHLLRTVLSERAACVVERRFGLGTGDQETLDDIGADYGVTRERIRQIQEKSLNKLREGGRAAALRLYLVDESKAGWSADSVERKAS